LRSNIDWLLVPTEEYFDDEILDQSQSDESQLSSPPLAANRIFDTTLTSVASGSRAEIVIRGDSYVNISIKRSRPNDDDSDSDSDGEIESKKKRN
jgi:hypothetical protein